MEKEETSENKTDLNKVLAWKSALVYLGGIIFVIVGFVFTAPRISWSNVVGFLISTLGILMIFYNLIMIIRSSQHGAIKIALIIPKIIFFLFFLMVYIFAIMNLLRVF